jgi:hypothetical protein
VSSFNDAGYGRRDALHCLSVVLPVTRENPSFPIEVTREEDNLCFIASDGQFALDQIDRALDRGPD